MEQGVYKEYLPDVHLRHLIEIYWVADGIVESSFTQRILPEGCVDIVFSFQNEGRKRRLLPELIGTKTSLFEFEYHPGRIQMLGIRFAPGAITTFMRIPVCQLTNDCIELALTETLLDFAFYDCLPEMTHMEERIDYINRYFIARLSSFYQPNLQIQYAVSLIRINPSGLSVRQLATEACLCERHFERKFKAIIGMPPKQFSNVIRFQTACRYLKKYPGESMFTAAIACGYHDHSHMNKEFQRLGGFSPSEWIL